MDGENLESLPSRTGGAVRRARREWLRRALPVGVLLLGVLGAPAMLVGSRGYTRHEELEAERARVEAEISLTKRRIVELRAAAQAIKTDPAFVERAARDQLGLVRKTEVVYLFEGPRPGDSAP